MRRGLMNISLGRVQSQYNPLSHKHRPLINQKLKDCAMYKNYTCADFVEFYQAIEAVVCINL